MSTNYEVFGFEYFDDPTGLGYRGYSKTGSNDGCPTPWLVARDFCIEHNVASAADWGCAKGFLVSELLAAGVDAVGYDVSQYALSFAKHLPCELRDLRDGPVRKVEVSFVLGVLLYVSESDLVEVLRGLRNSTERYLLFSSYYEGDPQDIPDPHRTITRSRDWWSTKIVSARFAFEGRSAAFDVYKTR